MIREPSSCIFFLIDENLFIARAKTGIFPKPSYSIPNNITHINPTGTEQLLDTTNPQQKQRRSTRKLSKSYKCYPQLVGNEFNTLLTIS